MNFFLILWIFMGDPGFVEFDVKKDAFIYDVRIEEVVDGQAETFLTKHIISINQHTIYIVDGETYLAEVRKVKSIVPYTPNQFIVNYENYNSIMVEWEDGKVISIEEFTIEWRDMDTGR